MEKSNLLSQVISTTEHTSASDFIRAWESCIELNLVSFSLEEGFFTCRVSDVVIADYDGFEIRLKLALNSECQAALISLLKSKGFDKPLVEDVSYFPLSSRIEGPSYIASYRISNEFNEIVQAMKELKIEKPILAKAKRLNEFFYDLTIVIHQESEIPGLKSKNKSNSSTVIKSAMVCLCLGFLNLEAQAEEKKPVSLEFNNELEEQVIRYKKVIDKHILENVTHNPEIEMYQDRVKGQVQNSANRAATEIIKNDYKVEERFRNKLSELEDVILGNNNERQATLNTNKKTSDPKTPESDGLKFKNKTRILQGQVKLEAGFKDYAQMKVEANAFASDKVRANFETKKVEFKDLGLKIYGHARYLSGDKTIVSGVHSRMGDAVDISIYNRQTQQKDKPSSENVVELRYQVDF